VDPFQTLPKTTWLPEFFERAPKFQPSDYNLYPMKLYQMNLDNCHRARGLVVVIDVLRAFTTAAYAIAAGVEEIILVSSVDEALTLRNQLPNSLVMGEVGGLRPDGFDFGNSPADLSGLDLIGKRLIQRTGAGTQGVVRSTSATHMWAASFVCALATVHAINRLQPDEVTFITTGIFKNRDGDEDIACADYLTALLSGDRPDPQPFLERVRRSDSGKLFTGQAGEDFLQEDLNLAMQIDRFNFSMPVERRDGLMVLHPEF